MKDILGRELHEGDVVVCKGSGSSYDGTPAKAMELGIIRGEGVRTLTSWRNPRDKFLIEHPSEMDMQVVKEIYKGIDDRKHKVKENQAKKTKGNEVGKIYKNTKGVYLYLGKGEVTSQRIYRRHNTLISEIETINGDVKTSSGNIYIEITRDLQLRGVHDFNDIKNYISSVSYGDSLVEVLKGYKAVDNSVGELDISKIRKQGLTIVSSSLRLKIKLD